MAWENRFYCSAKGGCWLGFLSIYLLTKTAGRLVLFGIYVYIYIQSLVGFLGIAE